MNGQWWENDLIVGPFADLAAANAWAAANPSSLFPGLLATAGGVQYKWDGSAWEVVGGGGNSNGSSSAPFTSTALRDAWALSNLGALTIGQRVFAFFDGTSIEYSWGGGSAINWIPVFSASENIHVGARKNIIAARALTTRAPRYLFYGDSNLAGEGAGTGVNGMFGARDMSFPVVMAKRLGWQTGSFFGDGNSALISTLPGQYDPRIVTGSWVTASPVTFGARWLQSSGASTQDLVFTPEGVCDRIAIWSARGAAYSMNMEVRVDGVVVGNISLRSPSSGYIPITYTVPLGAHVVSIRNIDTNNANVCGIETWDSTSKAPRLLHAGYCGANLATLDVVTSPYSPMSAILALAPDAATLHCTINDIGQSTAIASIAASISSMANRLAAINCDVIHTVSFASNHDGSIDGTLGVFADILRQTALGCGGAFADSRDILGATYAITAAKGVTFNGDHLLAEGYRLQSLHFAKLFA